MLSILIPIYKRDVRELVTGLSEQASRLGIEWEIVCIDDASGPEWQSINRELSSLEKVSYEESDRNLGRSRVRNRLAELAKHPYLLFMDCDSTVVDDNYLRNYLEALDGNSVLYGGRVYQSGKPADDSLKLHWKYGSLREQVPAEERAKNPYHSFMTCNFVVPSAVFRKNNFDTRLTQYGHEDTLFGLGLRRQGVTVVHLDNPLLHAGLEPAGQFIRKSIKAVENLAFLLKEGEEIETRLGSTYEKLKSQGRIPAVKRVLSVFEGRLLKNLQSSNPWIKGFDAYRLLHFIRAME